MKIKNLPIRKVCNLLWSSAACFAAVAWVDQSGAADLRELLQRLDNGYWGIWYMLNIAADTDDKKREFLTAYSDWSRNQLGTSRLGTSGKSIASWIREYVEVVD